MASEVGVRGATLEDRRAVWHWRNDQVTRNMFRPDPSVGYEEHCSWFEGILRDGSAGLFIGILDNLRIGCVRFRPTRANDYEAYLYLKPAYCGKGYAAPMLQGAVDYLVRLRSPERITARVRKNHGAARQLFEQAGFSVRSETETELCCELRCRAEPVPAAGKRSRGDSFPSSRLRQTR